ncbi:MAG: hypothetical protein ABIY51_05950 [Ferruginibacter sp.]
MDVKRKIQLVVKKVSFAEAEEADVEYYANINWKESVKNVEEMRRMIWSEEYKLNNKVRYILVAKLKDERDGVE